MTRPYFLYDVFAAELLEGNPLAVVEDASGLDDTRMQAIAREFNLSETVFILPPADARHRARLRIFTPYKELPFAGHPTIGAAAHLALRAPPGSDDFAFGLELQAGVTSCVAERRGTEAGIARLRAPKTPAPLQGALAPDAAAAALGLAPRDVGFGRREIMRVDSGGAIFQIVPVASVEALGQAAPGAAFAAIFGEDLAFLYALTGSEDGSDVRARMFGPQVGVPEDPATGSAAVAYAVAAMVGEGLGDGAYERRLRQGVEMGRPSTIALQLTVRDGRLDHVEIGGEVRLVAEGALRI